MTAHDHPAAFRLARGDVSPAEADAVLDGALVAEPAVAVVEIGGPGAVACMQGLLTSDLEKPGPGLFVYGAVLTPKGMIVTDLWAERDRASVRLAVPVQGHGALEEVFRRSLPPRLARPADRTSDLAAVHLVGPRAAEVAARAGLALPADGRWTSAILGETACVVARPPEGAPFILQAVLPRPQVGTLVRVLTRAGAARGGVGALELARILAGWPRLGAEIDERTLPQEVRFDEVGGVSYTKGCYTGQETVARIHFRGHPNRHLTGLSWDDEPDAAQPDVTQDGNPRGRVSSIAWVPSLERYLGLGLLRREVDPERPVAAAGATAHVLPLPFPVQ